MNDRARENIVLIGLPGSGKSSLGRRVAKDFGLGFRDTDELITAAAGIDIPGIFASRGEADFRELETETIRRLALTDEEVRGGGVIISTGGGAVLKPENVELFHRIGKVIFVDRKPQLIVQGRELTEGRPLLGSADDLLQLDSERRIFYERAAHIIFHNDGAYETELDRLRSVVILLGACGPMCLIGDPIGHSLSPFLHRLLFAECGIEHSYRSARIIPDKLETAVKYLRAGALRGLNVTKPHKIAIAPLLDELCGDAALSGAVNTVKKENGRLIGYNTDMDGLALALADRGRNYKNSVVTVFGAGGAAVGIATKALIGGARRVNVVCRRPADEVSSEFPDNTVFITHDIAAGTENEDVTSVLRQTDILINATPLGMSGLPGKFRDFRFLAMLRQDALVCDLIYEPAETELLREARMRRIETMNGLPMLVYQGILADEIVFGIRTDRKGLYEKAALSVEAKKGKHKTA